MVFVVDFILWYAKRLIPLQYPIKGSPNGAESNWHVRSAMHNARKVLISRCQGVN